MILDKPEHTLQRGSLEGEKQFKIALSTKMYSMLTDKLYTDQIGSVVREICSNAWDGMKMKSLATGQPIEPFRVTLPTDLEPHFIVEDFGVGMPDEQAQELYSTLGLSTKENTNDQIGAFGLGSKSPFAVTDTFTVENTYEGVTYYYLCFKSEGGLPSILATGQKKEERPNGVKVVIPAPGYNYIKYQNAIQRQLIAMEPKPIITNGRSFDFIEPGILCSNEFGYLLTNANQFGLSGRSLYIKMGMVLYPCDISQLNMNYSEQDIVRGLGYNACIVLNMPIGAVEPIPSREAITYDTRVIGNIRDRLSGYKKLYRDQLIKDVFKIESPIEAYEEVVRVKSSLGIDLFHEGICINGWPIIEGEHPNIFPKFEIEYLYTPPPQTDAQGVLLEEQPKSELKKAIESQYYYESFDTHDTRLNIVRTKTHLNGLRFNRIRNFLNGTQKFLLWDEEEPKHRISRMKTVLNGLNRGQQLLVVKVNPDYKGSKTDFNAFLAGLDNFHAGLSKVCVERFSEVEKPDFTRGERKVKGEDAVIEGIVVVKPHANHEYSIRPSDLEKLSEDSNFEKRAFYIKLHRNDCVDYKQKIAVFKEFSNMTGSHLFLVRAGGNNKIKDIEEFGVMEFKDKVNEILTNYTPSEIFQKRESCINIYNDRNDWFAYPAYHNVQGLIRELNDRKAFIPPFFDRWKEVFDIKNSSAAADEQTAYMNKLLDCDLLSIFKEQEWAKSMNIDVSVAFNKAEQNMIDGYPLLPYLFGSDKGYTATKWLYDARAQYVVDYTKMNEINEIFTELTKTESID